MTIEDIKNSTMVSEMLENASILIKEKHPWMSEDQVKIVWRENDFGHEAVYVAKVNESRYWSNYHKDLKSAVLEAMEYWEDECRLHGKEDR